jgi:hypothetical protein
MTAIQLDESADVAGNVTDNRIFWESTSAAATPDANHQRDHVSNGIKVRGAHATVNNSGTAMLYMHFGIQPLTNGAINQGRAK